MAWAWCPLVCREQSELRKEKKTEMFKHRPELCTCLFSSALAQTHANLSEFTMWVDMRGDSILPTSTLIRSQSSCSFRDSSKNLILSTNTSITTPTYFNAASTGFPTLNHDAFHCKSVVFAPFETSAPLKQPNNNKLLILNPVLSIILCFKVDWRVCNAVLK